MINVKWLWSRSKSVAPAAALALAIDPAGGVIRLSADVRRGVPSNASSGRKTCPCLAG
ncbi:MAG TPA: hypothetical protein VK400_07760 [Pyrinomonadaceae bacterium]|nr:hypothetical protein [Pyrinomonadaceae bacterium]